MATATIQVPLPDDYIHLGDDEIHARITEAKQRLGGKLLILGHHYQRDEIIRHADLTGDSYKLAKHASQTESVEYIVFCGVHFMAESADILSQPHQVVILPNMTAGCSMADMADIADVEACWEQVAHRGRWLPITYINSAASLKAFVGANGGTVCTSSNAAKALTWGWGQADKLLFFPDEHLGRNSALRLGIPEEQMVVWDPGQPLGGDSPGRIENARLVLWKGYCSVHMRFSVAQVEQARKRYSGVRVIVHPECRREVVDAADEAGSTEQIIKAVEQSGPGSKWAIGTEINLVHRLALNHPDKTIFCLNPTVCVCSTMYRIHPRYLAWVLDNLLEGRIVNRVDVPPDTAERARLALSRMLSL